MPVEPREPRAEVAVRLLLARIQDGEWSVGSKLPGETTLAPQLGVGRSTLREAIRKLVGQGYLATRQGSGVTVLSLRPEAPLSDSVSTSDMAHVVEARIAVEVEASALAALRRLPEDIQALHEALTRRDAVRQDVSALVEEDLNFHRQVVLASHNPLLLDMYDAFLARSQTAMLALLELSGDFGGDTDHRMHVELVDAIRQGQAEEAGKLSRAHLMQLGELLVRDSAER